MSLSEQCDEILRIIDDALDTVSVTTKSGISQDQRPYSAPRDRSTVLASHQAALPVPLG